MITFSNLSLSADRTTLSISCSGTASEQIAAVLLEYYENYNAAGPSDKVWSKRYSSDSYPSSVDIAITEEDLEGTCTDKFIDGLFYVYVQYYESGNTTDLKTAVAVVLDWERVYMEAMSYLKYLSTDCNRCKDVQDLVDFILRWELLKLALDTCDWETLHCVWARLFMKSSTDANCGCS